MMEKWHIGDQKRSAAGGLFSVFNHPNKKIDPLPPNPIFHHSIIPMPRGIHLLRSQSSLTWLAGATFQYWNKVRQCLDRFKTMPGPRAVILMYHRVSESELDQCLLRVTPQHFAEHLQVIREYCRPMRLDQLARGVRDGNLTERSVGVTFDDGYQETLYTVKPILERYEVPATVFTTTGTSGRSREFWWDELERILLQPGDLPAHLQLSIAGRRYNWDLGEYSTYSRADFQHYKDWNLLDINDPTPRHCVYRALHELIMYLGAADQQQVLDQLLNWAGMKLTVRGTHRALETDEIVELEKGGLLEVGVHTVNHLALPQQAIEVQDQEIKQSKSFLERLLGHQVKGFAYPYGFCSKASVTLSRQAGFEYACAGSSESIHKKSDLFKLPRMEVLDWVGEKFAQRLKKLLRCEKPGFFQDRTQNK